MKQIKVVAAIIHDGENRILATQRGYGEWKGWWEFPGGKIEVGETKEEALEIAQIIESFIGRYIKELPLRFNSFAEIIFVSPNVCSSTYLVTSKSNLISLSSYKSKNSSSLFANNNVVIFLIVANGIYILS